MIAFAPGLLLLAMASVWLLMLRSTDDEQC